MQAYLVSRVRFFFADTAFAGRLLDWAHTILRTTANAAITDAIAERTRSSHGT